MTMMRRAEEAPAVSRFIDALARGLCDEAPSATLRSARRHFEREYVSIVLRRHGGNVGEAARALGIRRTNLYRKARQLGIPVRRTRARAVLTKD